VGAVDSLAAWGIQRPADVVAIADAAGLPLAAACALLDQESGGGHNVWGHDRVTVAPGTYVMGAEVTEQAYRAYRAALAPGRAGQQGVGPCQLTARDFQDAADKLGGCWLPIPNMRVGFGLLANYARLWPLADAFRAYNGGAGNRVHGSNVNADRYSDDAMARFERWQTRLGVGDDMPLTQADADLVVATLLRTPLLDLFPDKPNRNITLAETLQWAAANAGRAKVTAERLLAALAAHPASGDLHEALLDALEAIGPLELIPTSALNNIGKDDHQ
jgi:hypothetical protein